MKSSRRGLFAQVGSALYVAALSHLLGRDARSAGAGRVFQDLAPRQPQRAPKARAVIHLFMNGGPSQMDLFDPKPELDKRHGEEYFDKIAGEVEFPDAAGALLKSAFKFAQHGDSGMWVSDAMPHFATQVDKVTLIKSLYSTNLTHEPALYKIHSGSEFIGRPTIGAWVSYGLGTENQDLPAYVVLDDPLGLPVNGIDNWSAGYLPPQFQGTRFRATGAPVLNLRPDYDEPPLVTQTERELIALLDRQHADRRPLRPQLAARIASYELAARMQLAAGEALDLSQETEATLQMYGIDQPVTESYGRRCLIARRLIERGVRFVQLFINSQIWDNHGNIGTALKEACDRTDKPIAALLTDLQQRGLLDETLVLWGGEMGRLPIAQLPPDKDPAKAGRDHNKNAICTWMAGGGVKQGFVLGATDELGFAAVENRVSVPDWHATVLHLLGVDHEHLSVEQNGLQEKLTGVLPCRVIEEVLA
ncbi:MAG: DUF1501 domain-containing protein [Planctomycetaceae bacterium]